MNAISEVQQRVGFPPTAEVVRVSWTNQSPPPHGFLAGIYPDEDGGFCALAVNYPGVISEGETIEETKANIAEAFMAMLEARQKHGEAMQFSTEPADDFPRDCKQIWINING